MYVKPMMEFVELKPEERLATCIKCPGKGDGTPGGNNSNDPSGSTTHCPNATKFS